MAPKYRRKRHKKRRRTLAESMIANSRSDNAGIFFVSCCSTGHEHLIFFVRTRVCVPTTECCMHRRLGTDDLPHGIPHRVLRSLRSRKQQNSAIA